MRWFESRRGDILRSPQLKESLAALPIFPGASGLRPLSELTLPGDFTDPIGVATLVDLNQLDGRREFLHDLGAKELTFQVYAADYIPQAFRGYPNNSSSSCFAALYQSPARLRLRCPLWQRGPTDAKRRAGGFLPSDIPLGGFFG